MPRSEASTTPRVVSAEKNGQDKFDCPEPDCTHKGGQGLGSVAGLAAHVRGSHPKLWRKLYKKAWGEFPPVHTQAGNDAKPMNGVTKPALPAMAAARYSARPKIDRKMEADAHENSLATMQAAADIMALPTVRALSPGAVCNLMGVLATGIRAYAGARTNPA